MKRRWSDETSGPRLAALHRLLDRALRAPPPHDEEVARRLTVDIGAPQGALERRELEAARAQCLLVALVVVVRHVAVAVVREAGDRVHATGLAGDEPAEEPGPRIPVVLAWRQQDIGSGRSAGRASPR